MHYTLLVLLIFCAFLSTNTLCLLKNIYTSLGNEQTIHKDQLKGYLWIHQVNNASSDYIFKSCKIITEDSTPGSIYQQYSNCFILISLDTSAKDYVICIAYYYPFCNLDTQSSDDNPLHRDFIASFTKEHYQQLRHRKGIKLLIKNNLSDNVSLQNTHDTTFIKGIIAKAIQK